MARGRFITFEGIDGAGKSTAIEGVAVALRAAGRDVVVTREETETYLGEAVRRSIEERAPPLTTAFLFLADRYAHAPAIEADVAAGKDVLCDRYMHSTLAYQSVAMGTPDAMQFLRGLHASLQPLPDAVVLLDIDPEVAMQRVLSRGATAPYEKVAFLASVRRAYLDLARTDGLHVVDADQPPDAVVAACRAALGLA